MSADNGIYILKTKAEDFAATPFEYRVIHAQAIENIYWDHEKGNHREDGLFTPEIAFEYFAEAPLFSKEEEALEYAHKGAEAYPVLEYGVCFLDHGEQEFQVFSDEEISEFERRGDELMEERRRKRQREVAEDLARRTVSIPRNTYVTVGGWIAFADPDDDSDHPEILRGGIRSNVVVLLNEDVEVIRDK